MSLIPVVDLFAGPGGLGEGFSALRCDSGKQVFDIVLSIEKDFYAHKTLELRSFFRKFPKGQAPEDYYDYIRKKSLLTNPKKQEELRSELFNRYPDEAEKVRGEVWCAELGKDSRLNEMIDFRIREILESTQSSCWGMIGGPPCQAYSVIGRARNGAKVGYNSDNDKRSYLYEQYLRVIAQHKPDFFIMENVKGMLSAKLKGKSLFGKVIEDLRFPRRNLTEAEFENSALEYQIFPLACDSLVPTKPSDYLIEAESFGIPQMRHRVIQPFYLVD